MLEERFAKSKTIQSFKRSNANTGKLLHLEKDLERVPWRLLRSLISFSYALVPKAKGVQIEKLKDDRLKGWLCTP